MNCLLKKTLSHNRHLENDTPKSCNSFKQKDKKINHTYQYAHWLPYQQFKEMIHHFVSDRPLVDKLYGVFVAQTILHKRVLQQGTATTYWIISRLKLLFKLPNEKNPNPAGHFNGV